MKECIKCGMIYLERTWHLDVLFERFSWEQSVEVENNRRDELRGVERTLSKKLRKRMHLFPRKNVATLIAQYALPGNVLDIGSGSGHYLLQLPKNYVPFGIEISTHAVKAGSLEIEKCGGRLVNKDALTGMKDFETGLFTGIIMRSFLEHDSSPKETLEQAYRILRPGGIVVVKVPNYACLNRIIMGAKWCGFRFPEHVNYFTPRTLTRILEETGFSIRRFSIRDRLPTSDNMWLIAKKTLEYNFS